MAFKRHYPAWGILTFMLFICLPEFQAEAGRREGSRDAEQLTLQLSKPARFGEVLVPARLLRLSVVEGGFALADIKTMFLVSKVSARVTELGEFVATPTLDLVEKNQAVTISVRYRDKLYRAQGITTTMPPKKAPAKIVSNKKGFEVEPELSKRPRDAQLIMRAIRRYTGGVMHCGQSALRYRWKTDEPKFIRCACPITTAWRLPKIKKPLRLSMVIEPKRSGLSFTATTRGRVADCRVWVGAEPPKGEPPLIKR